MPEPRCQILGRGHAVLITQIIMFVFSTLAVTLRTYVRGRLVKQFGFDDWCSIFGYILFTAYLALTAVTLCYGNGEHIYVPRVLLQQPKIHKFEVIGNVFYLVSGIFVKFSIALQLRRFTMHFRKMNCTIYITLAIFVSASLANLATLVFFCRPLSYFWTQYPGVDNDNHCLSFQALVIPGYVFAGTLCMTDWILASIPFFLVKKLPSACVRTKVMVVVTLSIGSIASIATIVRIVYVRIAVNSKDYTWDMTGNRICTCLELGLAIVASNLATLKPLFVRISSMVYLRSKSSASFSERRLTMADANQKRDVPEIPEIR